jgi:hypothetical protein
MKTVQRFFVVFAITTAALFIVAPNVQAAPIASFTASTSTPRVGQLVTFNGSASTCGATSCRYQWSWTYKTSGGQTLNGGQIGEGKIVSYRFDAFAASKSSVTVKLKVTASGATNNYGLATRVLRVLP